MYGWICVWYAYIDYYCYCYYENRVGWSTTIFNAVLFSVRSVSAFSVFILFYSLFASLNFDCILFYCYYYHRMHHVGILYAAVFFAVYTVQFTFFLFLPFSFLLRSILHHLSLSINYCKLLFLLKVLFCFCFFIYIF